MQRTPPPASTVVIVTPFVLLALVAGPAGSAPPPAKPAPPRPAAAKPMAAKPPSPAAKPAPASAPAAPVWVVDKAASRISFQATLGGQAVDGVFKAWDAEIAFDPKNLRASHATVTVETTSALTGQPTRDELLPMPNWLSTRKFPKATLVSRSIVQTGPGRYQASAELKLRGISRRVSVPFTLSISHDTGKMVATMMLDRMAFGVGQVPGMQLTSLAPAVRVNMRLTAKRDH